MNYYPFFMLRSWNNGVSCMSFYILTEGHFCSFRVVYNCSCYSFIFRQQWNGVFHYTCQSLQMSSVKSYFRRCKTLTSFYSVVCVQKVNEGFAPTALRHLTQNIKQILPLWKRTKRIHENSFRELAKCSERPIHSCHWQATPLVDWFIVTRYNHSSTSGTEINGFVKSFTQQIMLVGLVAITGTIILVSYIHVNSLQIIWVANLTYPVHYSHMNVAFSQITGYSLYMQQIVPWWWYSKAVSFAPPTFCTQKDRWVRGILHGRISLSTIWLVKYDQGHFWLTWISFSPDMDK